VVLTGGLVIALLGAVVLLGRSELRLRRLREQLVAVTERVRLDSSTPLRNQAAFGEDVELELLRAERTGHPASLVVIALAPSSAEDSDDDRFRLLAREMRATLRTVDVGYRIARDEFAVILPDTRARGALLAVGRLELALRAQYPAGPELRAGIAEAGPGLDRHELFRNAYCALLAAGRQGRANVLTYSVELMPSSSPVLSAADATEVRRRKGPPPR
jgi:GGDEF domain-containing protein